MQPVSADDMPRIIAYGPSLAWYNNRPEWANTYDCPGGNFAYGEAHQNPLRLNAVSAARAISIHAMSRSVCADA